jgi:hypothetical protein
MVADRKTQRKTASVATIASDTITHSAMVTMIRAASVLSPRRI